MPKSSKDRVTLPTAREFIKANPPESEVSSWEIKRITWKDEWKSVTFYTDLFRYSLKGETPEEYRELTNWIMDGFTVQGLVYAKIEYIESENEWIVYWENPEDYPDQRLCSVDKFDWGIIVTPTQKRPDKKSPARKQKPASKSDE